MTVKTISQGTETPLQTPSRPFAVSPLSNRCPSELHEFGPHQSLRQASFQEVGKCHNANPDT